MAGYTKLLVVSCLLILLAKGEDDEHGSHAVSYDKEAFEAAVQENRNFVMFYAPWCGHCKNLAPTWNELAKFYNQAEESPVVIAKVDCTIHTELCASHEVVGFPTLKLFEVGGGSHKRYSGKRDIESLKYFIQGHLVDDEAQETATDEPPKEAEVPEVPEPKSSLVTLTDDNFSEQVASGYFFIKFYAPWCGHCRNLAPTWHDLAQTFSQSDKVTIAKIDCTQSTVMCKKHGVRGYPTLLWFKDGEKIDEFNGLRNHDVLKMFVSDHLQTGQQEEQHAHEEHVHEEPQVAPEGSVQDLTDANFISHLASKLVFVKFYAPWCGHCKRLAPTWDDLAREVKSLPVSIAKVDCTQYKSVCDDNQVRGYPTLKIFRNGDLIKDYKGSRTLELLHIFVKDILEGHDEL